MRASVALFYSPALSRAQLVGLATGQELTPALEVLEFPAQAPRAIERELAVPRLHGMDDIEVVEARVALRAEPKLVDTEDYKVTANGTQGIFLSLPSPRRLKKVELTYTEPTVAAGAAATHVVLRAATRSGSGFVPGPPLFAAPALASPGPLFSEALGGMTLSILSENRRLLTLPSLLGDAWLIQLARGDSAAALDPAPYAVVPAVGRVTLDSAATNLSIVLSGGGGGGGEVKVWNNPEALLPGAGEQEVSFTPLAQKQLAAALAAGDEASASAPTLPIRLRFDSDSQGAIGITARRLTAQYLVRPLGASPPPLHLGGSACPLVLNAPARLPPQSSQLRLVVKHLGRELNAASPELPVTAPHAGLRLDVSGQIASAAPVAPAAGAVSGSVVSVAAVRLYLGAAATAEAVLEIRADLAGAPGAAVAAPVVTQIDAGPPQWWEFRLPQALPVVTDQAPLWLALRLNKGEVRWFAAGDGGDGGARPSRISRDGGKTWAAPDGRLLANGALLSQIFHRVAGDPPAPVISVRQGASLVWAEIPLAASPKSRTEWVAGTALPSAIHALLAARPGQGKVPTELALSSRSVVDVKIESLVLRYDPFAASSPGEA